MLSPLEARPLTIIALGDSTTAGTPFFRSPAEAPPDGAGDPEAPYTYWLGKKHADWTVLNYGIAGQRTDGIRDRLIPLLAMKPKYVIILAGVNDIYQGVDPSMTTHNLAGMYKEIKRQDIIPIAASVLPFDSATPDQSAQIQRLNRWIKDAADKLNIPYVDLHSVVADAQNADRLNGSADGIHPDVGGYRQIGQALAKEIDRLESKGVLPR